MSMLSLLINPQRMREGYSTHFFCLCVCVSLTTLEATLIYSAKNEHQWITNGIFYLSLKNSNPANRLLRFRNSCLNSLHCTVLAKVQSSFQRLIISMHVGIECS